MLLPFVLTISSVFSINFRNLKIIHCHMSINFYPFQYNDEYLYEKNKKSNFDIEFDKFFFFDEEKV